MYGTSFEIYKTPNPRDKNAEWANRCITTLRRDWVPIVNQDRMRKNKQYLDSMQSLEWIKNSFKDKKFKEMMEDWDPIGIMEVFKNTLIEDILKAPPKAELKAVDPSAIDAKKKDIQLLRNRKIVEQDVNKYQQQVYGDRMPKYSYGKKNFKSNVDEMGRLNLNPDDPEELTFYELELQRLNFEIAGQNVINSVFKQCQFDQDMSMKLTRDILAAKVLTLQLYVDKMTGQIKPRYIYPETFYGIFGDKGDGSNDICNGWMDNISITEFLSMVGNEFVWERDWRKLLWAINFCMNTKYTGFIRNNTPYDCVGREDWLTEGGLPVNTQSNMIEWTMVFNYQINVGYVEWKTEEATSTFMKNENDPHYTDVVSYDEELTDKQKVEGYYKYSKYQQQTYCSYFLSTSTISQWIFGFSKLYYQQLHGSEDEFSSGSLKYYMLPGRSAVEIAKPYIKIANFAFYKMLWTIDKAKPEDEVVVIEELVQVAKSFKQLYPQAASNQVPSIKSILDQLIEYQRTNTVKLRAFPNVEGRPIPQLPPLEGKKNGVDPVYISMQAVLIWAEMQISNKIGVNPMRVGANPPPRESEKTEVNTVQNSMNATSYIYRMVQNVKLKTAVSILNFTQDIIRFKDSIPYKWLLKIVGDEDFSALGLLGDYAAHRYAIFVNDYNSDGQKQRVEQAADLALTQKTITLDQWALVTQSEDYKKALKLLALYVKKQEKKLRRQELENLQIERETKEQEDNREMERIQTKGKLDIEKAKIEADGLIRSAQIQSDGRVEVKEITVAAEGDKQQQKAAATKDINTSKEADKESKPFPAVAGGR